MKWDDWSEGFCRGLDLEGLTLGFVGLRVYWRLRIGRDFGRKGLD